MVFQAEKTSMTGGLQIYTNLHEKEWNANFSPFEASYHRIFKNARVTATPKPYSIQPDWIALYTYAKE